MLNGHVLQESVVTLPEILLPAISGRTRPTLLDVLNVLCLSQISSALLLAAFAPPRSILALS